MRRALLLIPILGVIAGCNPDDAFCSKFVECRDEEDDLDDDAVPVCQETLQVQRDIVAANKGNTCPKLQKLKDEWRSCMNNIADCDDFNDEISKPDECEDEFDEYQEFLEDQGAKCYVFPYPLPEELE